MSKYIEKVENYKQKTIGTAIEKLQKEYDEAQGSYRDTGYDRYFNKMNKCEAELQELEDYLQKDKVAVKELSTDQYREYLKMKQDLVNIKNKLHYLVADLGLPATADLIGMQDILRNYS